MSKEKKINYAIWLSVVSLILWCMVVGLWICNVFQFAIIDSNTFIGVIVALLGIIVTYVVAWQILNVIDIKTQVSDIADLKKELNQQRDDIDEDFYSMMYLHSIAFGDMALQMNNVGDAFNNYLWAVYYSLKLRNEFIDILQFVLRLENVANCLTDVNENTKEQIKNADSKIRDLPRYKYIKNEYEKAYQIYESKIANKQ